MLKKDEKWLPINYKKMIGCYEVSDRGRVRSLHENNYKHILKQYANKKTGYLTITLNNNGYVKTVTVHRLVALAFIPNKDSKNLIMINHKDEDKHNNNVDNLEWCTAKYNVNYGTAKARVKTSRLKNDTKIKIPIIISNSEEIREFNSIRTAAKFLGVSHSTVLSRLNHPHDFGMFLNGWKIEYKDSNRTSNISYDRDINHGLSNPNHKKSLKEVKKLISKKRPSLILVSGFTTTKEKANFKCLVCGNEFSTDPYSIYYQNHNCPICSRKISAKKRTLTRENAQQKLNKIFNGNIILGSNYKNATTPCEIICNTCGKKAIKSLAVLFNNSKKDSYTGNGCEHCAKSRNIIIRNMKRYNHTNDEIINRLHEKGLDWNLNI